MLVEQFDPGPGVNDPALVVAATQNMTPDPAERVVARGLAPVAKLDCTTGLPVTRPGICSSTDHTRLVTVEAVAKVSVWEAPLS